MSELTMMKIFYLHIHILDNQSQIALIKLNNKLLVFSP